MRPLIFQTREPEMFIEPDGLFVDRENVHAEDANSLGEPKRALQRINQQEFPKPLAPYRRIDCQSSEMHGRDGMRG